MSTIQLKFDDLLNVVELIKLLSGLKMFKIWLYKDSAYPAWIIFSYENILINLNIYIFRVKLQFNLLKQFFFKMTHSSQYDVST